LSDRLTIEIGVKSDPIEYRYSYEWLFQVMREEGVHHLQLGTFFEMYQLPDEWFLELRALAERHRISITSIFTAHRELGGFFRREPGWESVARKNYERLIEIGALVGAESVGSNPGAVLRDRPGDKTAGVKNYLKHMNELMHTAHACGLKRLCIEPMSCLAEPPTLPDELVSMAEDLLNYHREHAGTVPVGYCSDVSHGYADSLGQVVFSNTALFEASLPYLAEVHLKNTDARFDSTFGFTESERNRGIVDLRSVRDILERNAETIPLDRIVCYLEIGGPKLGRDYSDARLEQMLRESLRHISSVFTSEIVQRKSK
jgi:sugar phosphate isomerase/epimerase